MVLNVPDLYKLFQDDIDRLYEKMNRPKEKIKEDIKKAKLKLVESEMHKNLYLVYKDTVRKSIYDIQTKSSIIEYL